MPNLTYNAVFSNIYKVRELWAIRLFVVPHTLSFCYHLTQLQRQSIRWFSFHRWPSAWDFSRSLDICPRVLRVIVFPRTFLAAKHLHPLFQLGYLCFRHRQLRLRILPTHTLLGSSTKHTKKGGRELLRFMFHSRIVSSTSSPLCCLLKAEVKS